MNTDSTTSPTVVLVHGAFADASSWSRVIPHLAAAGVAVQAPANPLRSLTGDGEYIAGVLGQIDGPVVLVGHSYGGPVITYASAKAPNVKALVYVASFGLDMGVSTLGSVDDLPPSDLGPALQPRTYPTDEGTGTELYIAPKKFPAVFAGDLPPDEAQLLAVSQRPAADVAFGEPLGVEPGWKTIPSWFVVAGDDHAINPDAERAAAERMGATKVEIDGGSHAIALSQADRVSEVILEAVQSSQGGA
jgi:pimeloyl-ACP methyl ester carboxylesterase